MGFLSRHLAWPALTLLLATPVVHADNDVAALRAELAALKADYAQRVNQLESRIDQLEEAAQLPVAVAQVPPPSMPSVPSRNSNAFNPAVAVIFNGTYKDLSQDPDNYRIAGFIPANGEVGPGDGGFSLGESELSLSASVDPYFTASLTAAIDADGGIEVEEAVFRTLALPAGFSLKGGRFFSGVGYLNEIHAHGWDFTDQPLVYQAMFGRQFAQDGLQVKWLAPTDLFLELGAEAGNSDAFPGTRRDRNGFSGTALFAHAGGDIGDSIGWRTGLSWMNQHSDQRSYDDLDSLGLPVTNAFTGKSETWIVDATLKWSSLGDPLRRQLKLQAEYMHRSEDGSLAFDVDGAAQDGGYHSSQSGWYLQGVYRFLPRWRAGLRYDSLDSSSLAIGLVQDGMLTAADFPMLAAASPGRTTVMLDFSPSEFSRLRVQYAWDDARGQQTDRQFWLQYIYAMGAHGAHKF
jgi:hypothetical protein